MSIPDSEYRTFLFSYYHAGSHWSFDIQATSAEDAKERLKKIAYATYDGELAMVIPGYAPPLFVSVICWLRNLVAKPNDKVKPPEERGSA